MEKQVTLVFSLDEAKIIFDALSSHRHKIMSKKGAVMKDPISRTPVEDRKREFIEQRNQAIEFEITKANQIFEKIGQSIKELG